MRRWTGSLRPSRSSSCGFLLLLLLIVDVLRLGWTAPSPMAQASAVPASDDPATDSSAKEASAGEKSQHNSDPVYAQPLPLVLHMLESVVDLQSILTTSKGADDTIWTILLYRDDPEECPHSIRALDNLKSLLPIIQREYYEDASSPLRLGFAAMPFRAPMMRLLKNELGIESVPTLLFFRNQIVPPIADALPYASSKGEPLEPIWWAIVYKGTFRSPAALLRGLAHYWSRFRYASMSNRQRWLPKLPPSKAPTTGQRPKSIRKQQQYLESLTVSVVSLDHLQSLLLVPAEPGSSIEIPPPRLFPPTSASEHRRVLPLDPFLSPDEQESIRELLAFPADEFDDNQWILCRCDRADRRVAEAFDALAYVMSRHHDLLFCIWKEDCASHLSSGKGDNDEMLSSDHISVLRLSSSSSDRKLELMTAWNPFDQPSSSRPIEASDPVGLMDPLARFLSSLLRPAVMWMDRQSTAPIAFAPQYTTHATLIIDVHDNHLGPAHETEASRSAAAAKDHETRLELVQAFHQLCREYQKEEIQCALEELGSASLPRSPPSHLVCLIVPSTETRILTTFGIDIWSPLDEELFRFGRQHPHQTDNKNNDGEGNDNKGTKLPPSKDNRSEKDATTTKSSTEKITEESTTTDSTFTRDPVLPVLLVTNRTETEGLQRFYLDPPFSPEENIPAFVRDVLAGRVAPELQTATASSSLSGKDPDTPIQNAHHVSQWTSLYLQRRRQAAGTESAKAAHVLLMIYAPTCGHCKRLKIAWNTLGQLVHSLGWGDWLEVAQLDVSKEEFTAMGASLLPSVYYYYFGPIEEEEEKKGEPSEDRTTYRRGPMWFDSVEAGVVSDPLKFLDWLWEVGQGLELQPLVESLEASLEEE